MKKNEIKNIKNSEFLKKMDSKEIELLCEDIREYIIDNVSKTGGHLSPNLGVVDLTVALHKNFDFKKDKIIFDVGHQSYTHKILTGRANKFSTLRKTDGLSGFQSISEGDNYEAGHTSTSISAALGFALSRDMSKEDHEVIAVIGDASISNGLSYEGINHIGGLGTKVIVVLNDNDMSISKNVGALHNFFDTIRTTHKYTNVKDKTKLICNKIPVFGKYIVKLMKLWKKSVKMIFIKKGSFFEDLGFTYLGPINGHDMEELDKYLKMAKNIDEPVLLHVITKKGKGYKYAEEDQNGSWHGTGAFNIETGERSSKKIYANYASEALFKLAKKDKNIVAITPAMGSGSKLDNFKNDLPNQFIDVGIAEEHALVLANAMALDGKKPVVFIYSSFLQRGYDQVLHDIAKMNTSVTICIDRAGIIGEDGASHQGIYDISFLLPIPNVIITASSCIDELNKLINLSQKIDTPMFIRYSKNDVVKREIKEKEIKIGTWEKLKDGEDAVIITYGDFVDNALKIHYELKKENINIEIVNARFIKPIDSKYFNKIKDKKIFVYEESTKIGSLGSYLGSITNVDIIAIDDEYVNHGSRVDVLKKQKLDTESVIKHIKKELKK
ncbi:MAG: 1-deoxy-D-xylulose-5-phosphate synthase [bacterium]